MFKVWAFKVMGWVVFPIGIYVWWQSRDLKKQLEVERKTQKQAYRATVKREEKQEQLQRSKELQVKSLQRETKTRVNLNSRKKVLKQINRFKKGAR